MKPRSPTLKNTCARINYFKSLKTINFNLLLSLKLRCISYAMVH